MDFIPEPLLAANYNRITALTSIIEGKIDLRDIATNLTPLYSQPVLYICCIGDKRDFFPGRMTDLAFFYFG